MSNSFLSRLISMSNSFLSKCIDNLCYHFENSLKIFRVKTKYGATAETAVIVAGIYVIWVYARRVSAKGKSKNHHVFTRSLSIAALHGGNLALERLNDYQHARADSTLLDAAIPELKSLLAEPRPNFKKLQSTIGKLEMSKKEEEAVKILETELQKTQKGKKAHEAYEIEMLLVEMYIYKGDLAKALNCGCLRDQEISDARRPLYKAIIDIMQGKDASNFWDELKEIRAHLHLPPNAEDTQLDKLTFDYEEFEKVVKVLKNDITNAHTRK